MDTWMIDGKIDFWVSNGLVPIKKRDDKEYWHDMFAISTGMNQFITDCDWIEINYQRRIVWLKGTDPIEVYPNPKFRSYNNKR